MHILLSQGEKAEGSKPDSSGLSARQGGREGRLSSGFGFTSDFWGESEFKPKLGWEWHCSACWVCERRDVVKVQVCGFQPVGTE